MKLRYGMNPQQATAHADPVTPGTNPVRILHGQPSLINMLDALNAWQLVLEATRLMGRPAAASFKHTSPAGAATSGPLDETAAVSHPVDDDLAALLSGLVCDGIIAPGYAPGTAGRLSGKKGGRFLIMEADPAFTPSPEESREVFGIRLTQERDQAVISRDLLTVVTGPPLRDTAVDDLLLGMTVLRYTQSNSVCYTRGGMTLGIGAGQQSRVDCTRLAGAKAGTWWLRRHPAIAGLGFAPGTRRQDKINQQTRFIESNLTAAERAGWMSRLSGVAFASDGYLPFRDNVDHAHRHGVSYIAEPGGSVHSDQVTDACREHGITLARTGLRLFHH